MKTSYRLVVKGGKLVAEHQRRADDLLRPLEKDRFAVEHVDFPHEDFRFHREPDGRVMGFRVTLAGARSVRFDRQD